MKNFTITLIAVLLAGGAIWGLNRNAILWEVEADRIINSLNKSSSYVEDYLYDTYEDKTKIRYLAFGNGDLKRKISQAEKHLNKLAISADKKPLEEALYSAQSTYNHTSSMWEEFKNKGAYK